MGAGMDEVIGEDGVGKGVTKGLLQCLFAIGNTLHSKSYAVAPPSGDSEFSHQSGDLADLLANLNRYVCAHSQQGRRFTTAIVAEYDPQTRELAYINAGHNAPVLRRSSGQIERLSLGGVPLGVNPAALYESASLRLEPDDLLVFFTDGVVEAFNEQGAEFGEPRWLAAISSLANPTAAAALQQLMAAVDEFVGTTRQFDDITCMVFRVLRSATS